MTECLMDLDENGYVESAYGQRIHYQNYKITEPWQKAHKERAAVNAVNQGTAADGMRKAMVPVHRDIEAIGGNLILTVHDELVAEVTDNKVDLAATLMVGHTEGRFGSMRVPITVVVKTSHDWIGK